MKKNQLIFMFCLFSLFCFGQKENDSIQLKSNPIIFGDFLLGGAAGTTNGFVASTSINYQFQKNLIKFKTTYVAEVEKIYSFFYIPFDIQVSEVINEYDLMFGRRFINYNHSWSYAIGGSWIHHKKYDDNEVISRNNRFGLPFEINYRLFKGDKKRLGLLYGLIKVGKETGFGRNIGFQLFGNLGKTSYIGFGVTYGLGWHKKH